MHVSEYQVKNCILSGWFLDNLLQTEVLLYRFDVEAIEIASYNERSIGIFRLSQSERLEQMVSHRIIL